MIQSADPAHHALDAHAEAAVRHAAVPAQVEIPLEGFLRQVVLLDPLQQQIQIRESFATADVFVVSLKRGLAGFIVPSKVYGVLVAGRPYIAAIEADSEVAQIAREHDCGIVVEPGDREPMAAAIRRLHDNPALRERLGVNARAASLHYDRARAVDAYRDVIEEAVS